MSNTTHTINKNGLFKLQDNSCTYVGNGFPIRRLKKSSFDNDQAWIAAYRAENKKYFEAVLTSEKLEDLQTIEKEKEQQVLPTRKILKNMDLFLNKNNDSTKNPEILDGFYLMQLCCVEDPLDISVVKICNKNLHQINEEDMNLFENLVEINANENFLSFEAFKCFTNLKSLNLVCNNIKSVRIRHEDFVNLETLDLSFNNLSPIDVAHLGVLKRLKMLKLTGNNLQYLPDTFSKLYVYTKDNKKIVAEKFPNLEELYLDQNNLKEEDSFDVLSVLKKLKRLHLNSNNITCIPHLKVFRKNHVIQEFNKSYYKRKSKQVKKKPMSANSKSLDLKTNETMVKDLDRPSSEMNIHNSNTFRNSFILEEEEEELENERSVAISPVDELGPSKKLSASSFDQFADNEKPVDLPFPELVHINLADNQIAEEDDLIALASWPMLNEIIIYGNPIVYNNVGYPPLLKQYLIDRLGINIHRVRPLKPLKTPVVIPQREHRTVNSNVPKVHKIPVEMRMLTFDEDENARRLSISSSADPIDHKRVQSQESFDTDGPTVYHNFNKSENVFKPFRQQADNKLPNASRDNKKNTDMISPKKDDQSDHNSFFMTQGDQEETPLKSNRSFALNSNEYDQVQNSKPTQGQNVNNKHKNYEILFEIENEDKIKVPKDIGGSVRVLKQMLDNPMVLREPKKETEKPLVAPRTTLTNNKPSQQTKSATKSSNKLNEMNEILDSLRQRQTFSESNLRDTLMNTENKKEYEKAKVLFEKAQKRYEEVKRESLLIMTKKSQDNLLNLERNNTTSETN